MTVKKKILFTLKWILPTSVFTRLIVWRAGMPEQELKLLPLLCDGDRASIDVGGADGVYTRHMLGHSKKCLLFEPRPAAAAHLERMFKGLTTPVVVERVALSDVSGRTELNICLNDEGLSTIEEKNPVIETEDVEKITVRTSRLDEYDFEEPIGVIKIDVEGHEEAVLRGATASISRDHPSLIIEIEERHNPGSLDRIASSLKEMGYSGYFFLDGSLESIDHFDPRVHQNLDHLGQSDATYINNFLFLESDGEKRVKNLMRNP